MDNVWEIMKIITFFNHKGGVAKTTNAFHLGWKLAERGSRVVLVDADSQCNLTGIAMGINYGLTIPPMEDEDYELSSDSSAAGFDEAYEHEQREAVEFWEAIKEDNIFSALAPAFNSEPRPLEPVDCQQVEGNENLYLLPGSLEFASYESDLALAQSLQGALGSQRNIPGAINALLRRTGEKLNADYMIVDVSPSLGAINQNIVSVSDQVIIPCSPDYFSQMALQSLASILPAWKSEAEEMAGRPALQNATYPFPRPDFKFGGLVIARYNIYKGKPASAFATWIDNVSRECCENLVPALQEAGLTLPQDKYEGAGIEGNYVLASVREFNSLRPKSQLHGVPTYALTQEQIGLKGKSLKNSLDQVAESKRVYEEFADRVISLLSNE